MLKGHVLNNSGKSRHIFKRTVYPGQRVPLDYVYSLLSEKVDSDVPFVEWLKGKLPPGWELTVQEDFEESLDTSSISNEDVREILSPDESESLEYATLKDIDKLTARDIFNLRMKDNPKKVIKQVSSLHKLRRALTMCHNDSRKSMLATILRHRIKQLGATP